MCVISSLKKSCDVCVRQTDSVLGLNKSLKGPLSNNTKHHIIEYWQYPYHEPKPYIHQISKMEFILGG